jgi:ketosteroid isomerase-like protein
MSRENLEIVRRAFESWQAGGATTEAIPPGLYADDVEWDFSAYPLVDVPVRGRGRDNLLEVFAKYFSGWWHYKPEAHEFIDAGEQVVTGLHETVGLPDSDVVLERDVFQVWRLRDGKVVRYAWFQTREEALEAAGLRE